MCADFSANEEEQLSGNERVKPSDYQMEGIKEKLSAMTDTCSQVAGAIMNTLREGTCIWLKM